MHKIADGKLYVSIKMEFVKKKTWYFGKEFYLVVIL